jgi:galactan 5-O-arabinofuranosyltransferase
MTTAPSVARMREALTAGLRRGATAWVALGTWALLLLVGVLAVRGMNVNPLTSHGVVLPLAIGVPLGLVMFGLAARLRSTWLVGVAVGTYAAWAGTTIAAALVGTPFGFGIIAGDAGRMSALAMHFATTWHPGDAADPSLPPEYPPLYPMLIGRVAAWTGRPAWTLLQPAQVVVTSFAVVAGFLLWRRLVGDVAAFLISASVFVIMVEPSKGNEILSLSVYLPWLLGTFAVTGHGTRFDRLAPPDSAVPKPLHPVVSGILIGLIVPWSPQVLFLSLLSVVGLATYTWWSAERDQRRAVLVRWAVTIGVAFVTASWFVFPLAKAYLSGQVQVVADLWLGSPLVVEPFTIVNSHLVVITLLQLAGLLGVAAQLRRTWWAGPLAIYLAGVVVGRALMLIRFTATGHAFMLYYVAASLGFALNAAGVLTLLQVWRWVRPRLTARVMEARLVGVTLVAVLVATSGYNAWAAWAPNPRGIADNVTNSATQYSLSMLAHAERLPSGRKVRYHAPKSPLLFPTSRVTAFVHRTLGRSAEPNVVSDNQAVFAFNPWRDWLMPDRVAASGLTRWDYRHGLLQSLARTADPASLAESLHRLPFGGIDVLVLRVRGSGAAQSWNFVDVAFSPQAFAGPGFQVSAPFRGYVVVVRTGG